MYFDLGIHQVSTEYRSKYDIPPVLFYCTPHNHSNYKFYSNFTKLDLAQSAKVKVQNTVKIFHEFWIAESTDPCSKARISVSLPKQQEKSEWFKPIDHFLLNTIGNNKHEYLISLLCHLRATTMCESTIKVSHNSLHLCACLWLTLVHCV